MTAAVEIGADGAPEEVPPAETTGHESQEERERLTRDITAAQATLLQTLDRLQSAKEEHAQLVAENQILVKYVNNLMASTGQRG